MSMILEKHSGALYSSAHSSMLSMELDALRIKHMGFLIIKRS